MVDEDKPKHPGGRPKLYDNVEDMQTIIDKYFEDCKTNRLYQIALGSDQDMSAIKDQYAATTFITDDIHPTVSGLASALDMDRQSLLNYSKDEEFFGTIKKAKSLIESYVEQRLYGTAVTGCIFNLKNNFNWKDKTEIDQNTKVSINIDSKDADCA